MSKHPQRIRFTVIVSVLSVLLAACGGDGEGAKNAPAASAPPDRGSAASSAPAASREATQTPAATVATLADGPDVCFRAIAKHLGADVKVSEITSFFSTGSEINSRNDKPQGQMTSCTVKYQNPDDPRKLLSTDMDVKTGTFDAPEPLEIRVIGNAAEFKLEDHLIPLSTAHAAALTSVMQSQKAALDKVYSRYAWNGVRLEGPSAFDAKHTLRLDVEGRLASNDIRENGYASVALDGKTITKNHLLP